jgi:hypothetical protein
MRCDIIRIYSKAMKRPVPLTCCIETLRLVKAGNNDLGIHLGAIKIDRTAGYSGTEGACMQAN